MSFMSEQKRYNFWKWIIITGLALIVFFAGWLAGDFYDFIKGDISADFEYIENFENGLRDELKEDGINLPATAECIMGYKSVNTIEPYFCVMFTVSEEDFDSVLSHMWEEVLEDNSENLDVLADWFGQCSYNDIISNNQWMFVGAMDNYSLNRRIFYSEPIDGKRALALVTTG